MFNLLLHKKAFVISSQSMCSLLPLSSSSGTHLCRNKYENCKMCRLEVLDQISICDLTSVPTASRVYSRFEVVTEKKNVHKKIQDKTV